MVAAVAAVAVVAAVAAAQEVFRPRAAVLLGFPATAASAAGSVVPIVGLAGIVVVAARSLEPGAGVELPAGSGRYSALHLCLRCRRRCSARHCRSGS